MSVVEPCVENSLPKLANRSSPVRFRLSFEWNGQQPSIEATAFASGVCKLFLGLGGEARIVAGGEVFDDADLTDCRTLVQRGGIVQALSNNERTTTPFQWVVTLDEGIETSDLARVHVEVRFDRGVKGHAADPEVCWLQADSSATKVPIPVLCLLLSIDDPADFINGLVVLAQRYGRLTTAELSSRENRRETSGARCTIDECRV